MRQILEVGDIMRLGVPKEIKVHEYRVAITPDGVHEAVASGHVVVVETGSGKAVGFPDELYCAAGATIARSATDVFEAADMIVKVKEPQPHECAMLRPGQILFTYLHLAADRPQMKLLMASQCTAIAYETVTDDKGRLPLLAPMSEVAGRMAVQVGAHCLEIAQAARAFSSVGCPEWHPL
jgi:alanine dehydrogenase